MPKRSWMEKVTGVQGPLAGPALYAMVASLIFLLDLFWPGLSMRQLIRGGLIAGIWATLGFVRYLSIHGVVVKDPKHP